MADSNGVEIESEVGSAQVNPQRISQPPAGITENGAAVIAEEAWASRPRRIDIGLDDSARAQVTASLNRLLSNEAVLLVKTRKAHWDIVGPQFYSLHKLWDEQYARLDGRMDAIAERIRQLGGFPVATMTGWLEHSLLMEAPGTVSSPTGAVAGLLSDHELVIRSLRRFIELSCAVTDVGTADLLTGVIQEHEQMAWTLRAFLEGDAVQHRIEPVMTIPEFA